MVAPGNNADARNAQRDRIAAAQASVSATPRENVELFERAFESAAIGMAMVGLDGRFLRVNTALTELFGYTESDLLALDFQSVTHAEDLDADLGYVHQLIAGERRTYRMHKRYLHRDGHVVWALLSVAVLTHTDGSPRFLLSQIQDMTEQKTAEAALECQREALAEANARLEQLARVDPLMQIPNRRALEERLHSELERSQRTRQPLSVLFIDVDHFKAFNDRFGHPAGDAALSTIAEELTSAARLTDFVARYGGEEFAALVPATDQAGCELAAERLRAAVAAITSLPRIVTASIGATTFDPSGPEQPRETRAAALVARADEALYAAKRAGRNRVEYRPPQAQGE